MRNLKRSIPVAVTVLAVVAWWFISKGSSSLFFPPLQEIVIAFRETWLSRGFFEDAVPSLVRLLLGTLVAIVAGVVVGGLIGVFPRAEPYARPELEFMRALPPILVIPPMLLVLGTGDFMKVAVIAAASVWPILLATTDGVRAVEPIRADMGRAFRLPWTAQMRWIVLPTAIPHIWSGVRAAVPIAIVVMVASEYYSSVNGIGYFISQTSTSFRLSEMWSAVLLLGVIGIALNAVVARIGRYLDARYQQFSTEV